MSDDKQLAPAPAPLPAAAGDYGHLMELAISQGEAGVAALERLVALQERAQAQAAERAYSTALAAFSAEVPTVFRAREGAHGAAYAALEDIMLQVRPVLAAHGLTATFDSEPLDDEGARVRVWCIVRHTMGHAERASYVVTTEARSNRMNDTQRGGSALTYGKRYALGLALNIQTSRDTDGARDYQPPDVTPITEEQAADLEALADEVGADKGAMLRWGGCKTFADFPATKLRQAIRRLEGMRS